MSDGTPPAFKKSVPSNVHSRPEWDDEISLLELGSTLLEQRRLVVVVTLVVAVLAVLPMLFARNSYTSTAMVISAQSAGGADARLQGLAGQLGINLGGREGTMATAPAFLVELTQSRVILGRVLGDTIAVQDRGLVALVDLVIPLTGDRRVRMSEAQRMESALRQLRSWVSVQEVRMLAAVRISVTTESAALSHHIAERLLEELDRFNQELGQGRASDESRFVEGRLTAQELAVRLAENRLAAFLESNRQFRNSPELTFEHDRLQREVGLQQQVLVGLAQSREEVRLRSVRDTPVLTVIEAPSLPVERDPKGRVKRGVLGLVLGGLLGGFLAFLVGAVRKYRQSDDPVAQRFMQLLRESLSIRAPRD